MDLLGPALLFLFIFFQILLYRLKIFEQNWKEADYPVADWEKKNILFLNSDYLATLKNVKLII